MSEFEAALQRFGQRGSPRSWRDYKENLGNFHQMSYPYENMIEFQRSEARAMLKKMACPQVLLMYTDSPFNSSDFTTVKEILRLINSILELSLWRRTLSGEVLSQWYQMANDVMGWKSFPNMNMEEWNRFSYVLLIRSKLDDQFTSPHQKPKTFRACQLLSSCLDRSFREQSSGVRPLRSVLMSLFMFFADRPTKARHIMRVAFTLALKDSFDPAKNPLEAAGYDESARRLMVRDVFIPYLSVPLLDESFYREELDSYRLDHSTPGRSLSELRDLESLLKYVTFLCELSRSWPVTMHRCIVDSLSKRDWSSGEQNGALHLLGMMVEIPVCNRFFLSSSPSLDELVKEHIVPQSDQNINLVGARIFWTLGCCTSHPLDSTTVDTICKWVIGSGLFAPEPSVRMAALDCFLNLQARQPDETLKMVQASLESLLIRLLDDFDQTGNTSSILMALFVARRFESNISRSDCFDLSSAIRRVIELCSREGELSDLEKRTIKGVSVLIYRITSSDHEPIRGASWRHQPDLIKLIEVALNRDDIYSLDSAILALLSRVTLHRVDVQIWQILELINRRIGSKSSYITGGFRYLAQTLINIIDENTITLEQLTLIKDMCLGCFELGQPECQADFALVLELMLPNQPNMSQDMKMLVINFAIKNLTKSSFACRLRTRLVQILVTALYCSMNNLRTLFSQCEFDFTREGRINFSQFVSIWFNCLNDSQSMRSLHDIKLSIAGLSKLIISQMSCLWFREAVEPHIALIKMLDLYQLIRDPKESKWTQESRLSVIGSDLAPLDEPEEPEQVNNSMGNLDLDRVLSNMIQSILINHREEWKELLLDKLDPDHRLQVPVLFQQHCTTMMQNCRLM